MKTRIPTPLTEAGCGRNITLRSPRPHSSRRNRCVAGRGEDGAALRPHLAQRGVALVITLILLAVITTLAIAFLALTYRETAAVDSLGRTTDSELACEGAQQRARAEILAPFVFRNQGNNNGSEIMGPDFMVSVAWNVKRLDSSGMVTNPSPPVFVDTNRNGTTGPFEDRFYLDLNRNRYFEETGFVTNTIDAAVGGVFQHEFAAGNPVINWRVGDPQWIGILQDPRRPHTNDNRFIARYAFLVQPIGRSLDVNWIHNDVKGDVIGVAAPAPGLSGYFRNQGVGPFELNLGAFLCDLNANMWNSPLPPYNAAPYEYFDLSTQNRGSAFADAWQLLGVRCYSDRRRFDTMTALFGPGVGAVIDKDDIDSYADGLLNGGTPPIDNDVNPNRPWPGSDSKRHFFTPNDYFDRAKLGAKPAAGRDFVERLLDVSKLGNSYDRYSYYRMLAQMGTDSAAEEEGKVHVNFINVRSWLTGDQILATDLIPWNRPQLVNVPRLGRPVDLGRPGPELFFMTVVTNLLLREPDLAFTVTQARPLNQRTDPFGIPMRIPIFTNGSTTTTNLPLPGPLYCGRIHQILQLAANIYDATTGAKNDEDRPYYPSVFRPQFERAANGDVYITNYTLLTEAYDTFRNNTAWRDLDAGDVIIPANNDLVYGIPLIIGARKGFPNFNEIAVLNTAEATRKLTIFRATDGAEAWKTNQLFTLTVSTKVQVEARNAYQDPYPRKIDLIVGMNTGIQVSNSFVNLPYARWAMGYLKTFDPQEWPGEPAELDAHNLNYAVSPIFETNILNWATNTPPDRPELTNYWSATITNRMLFFLVDRGPKAPAGGRIVDAVTLNGPRKYFDVGRMMAEPLPGVGPPLANIWRNDRASANLPHSLGIDSQISVSRVARFTGNEEWGNYDGVTARNKDDAIDNFNTFIQDKRAGTNQVPFTPIRRIVQSSYFRVNDPLVHYNLEDLSNEYNKSETVKLSSDATNLNLGTRNPRSLAWNRGTIGESQTDPGSGVLNPTLRDPGLINSDSWDFPTNFFPNIGGLGRVHRGTPWQTIYLKSRGPSENWTEHSGPLRADNSANLMQPTRDWALLDIFTTAPHPNATRGRLSINQTNLAAWSAVLSGAMTSETGPHPDDPSVAAPLPVAMQPAALSPAIEKIAEGINHQRTFFNTNFNPFGQFTRLGQLLSTPELTDASPFLNVDKNKFDALKPTGMATITDADYERIPQQILSLVKLGEPRFVVYAWGQSLKPARRNPEDNGPSIVTSGTDKGLCRNYQITGEMATRAVIRVEFDRITDPASPRYNQLDYSRPHAVVESFNILPVE